METLFEELETQPKQKSQKKKLSEALESILDCVQNPIFPSYIARNLMKILHEVHGEVSAACTHGNITISLVFFPLE